MTKLHPILQRIIDFNQEFSGTFFDYYTPKEKEIYDNDIKDVNEILMKWSQNG